MVKIYAGSHGAKSTVRCDALMLDNTAQSATYPYMEIDEEDVSVNSYGASKPLIDAAARLAEAVDQHRRAETPLHVPLGMVRRATSEEIEQTGAVVDAVLAVYRQARAKGESRG